MTGLLSAKKEHLLRSTIYLALFLCVSAAQAVYMLGDSPEDFTLSDWNGESWNLYNQRGKVVLINFGSIS